MRILLVNPPAGRLTRGLKDFVHIEPLALEILAAAVPDHEVDILDLQFGSRFFDIPRFNRFEAKLREFEPDLVGVTATASHTYRAHELLQMARRYDPEIHTVVGGQHPTLRPGEFHAPYIDAIALGRGASTFAELVEKLEHGDGPESVPGLAIPHGDRLVRTPPRQRANTLADQPLPDRSITRQRRPDYYYAFVKPAAVVQTSQGCTFSCNFCSVRCFTERRFLPQPVGRVVEDLRRLEETFVYFADDHTFLDPRRMGQLADAIEEAGLQKRYLAYTRVDTVLRNPELFRRWADTGLDTVMMGLEAVDDRHLDAMDKRATAEDNRRALEILEECGVGVAAGFVIMPDYTEENFRAIEQFVADHSNILTAELTPYTPLPGTPLYDRVEDDLLNTHRELYDLTHFVLPTDLPAEKLQALVRKYYHRILRRCVARLVRQRPSDMLQTHTLEVLGAMMKTSLDYRHTKIDAELPQNIDWSARPDSSLEPVTARGDKTGDWAAENAEVPTG